MAESPFSGTLTVAASHGGAPYEVTFWDRSTDQAFTSTYRGDSGAVLEERVRWGYQKRPETASDCSWQPPPIVLPRHVQVGAKWMSSSTCKDMTPQGARDRAMDSNDEVLRGDSVKIDGENVAVYVVRRVQVTRVNGSEEDRQVGEEWFAPALGAVVRRKVETTTPGAAEFARHSTTEWWVTGRG